MKTDQITNKRNTAIDEDDVALMDRCRLPMITEFFPRISLANDDVTAWGRGFRGGRGPTELIARKIR